MRKSQVLFPALSMVQWLAVRNAQEEWLYVWNHPYASGISQSGYACVNGNSRLAEKYPDAVFTLIAMNNLFHHDREFSEIHQEAFSSILDGEDISSVQFRYNRRMDAYLQAHLWDD